MVEEVKKCCRPGEACSQCEAGLFQSSEYGFGCGSIIRPESPVKDFADAIHGLVRNRLVSLMIAQDLLKILYGLEHE